MLLLVNVRIIGRIANNTAMHCVPRGGKNKLDTFLVCLGVYCLNVHKKAKIIEKAFLLLSYGGLSAEIVR